MPSHPRPPAMPGGRLPLRPGRSLPIVGALAIAVAAFLAASGAIPSVPTATDGPASDAALIAGLPSAAYGTEAAGPTFVQPESTDDWQSNAPHPSTEPAQNELKPTPLPTVLTFPTDGPNAPGPTAPPQPPVPPTAGPQPSSAPTPHPTPTPTPHPTPTPTPKPTSPPPSGVHLTLGAWAGQPWNVSSLQSFSSLVGGTPGMFLTYLSWPDRAQYVASDEKAIANLGASHVMTWEPFGMTLKSIVNGDHDAYIHQYAKGAAAYGKRFYIRLMHEMNGDWYPWGRGVGGNTAADFVNAWRHVVDIFNAEGATNVKWVWSPNVRYGSEYPFANLYPGSSYVDWVALDGYNWGSDPHLGQPAWQSFGTIFGSSYDQLTAVAPGKPMIIAETASTEHGGNKANWIINSFMTGVLDYPAIKSVVWFNQADGQSDFRVNSSQAALDAFKQVVDSSLWNAKLP